MAPPAFVRRVVEEGGVMSRSDFLRAGGAPPWWGDLICNDQGWPRKLLDNASIPFEKDPLFVDKFWFDKFQMKILVNGPLPWNSNPPPGLWELEKGDELEAWRWLERANIPTDHRLTLYAIAAAAHRHTFHPVLDYLNGLSWDGVDRLDTWTVDYLGTSDTPLVRAMASCWMISAVARIYQPGCKADYAIVLEGKQGDLRKGKSTALYILGQPWFTDDIAELGSKDAAEQTVGRWIIELSELDAMMRSDPMRTKSFISRRIGRFRWSYDPAVREYPRQCVFAGTVNDQNWSRDPTGNRRVWPMWCTRIDVDGLELVRHQLWAEARDRYFAGERWWIEDQSLVADAREEQEIRYSQDPWEEKISDHLSAILKRHYQTNAHSANGVFREAVAMGDLLDIVGVRFDRHSLREQVRVANILRRLEWTKKRMPKNLVGINAERAWRYVPPGYDPISRTIKPGS